MNKLEQYHDEIIAEWQLAVEMKDNLSKDILIVAHNQLDYLKACVESIKQNTINYQLLIYDNASDEATQDYIGSLKDAKIVRSEINRGFIEPNNTLALMGESQYIILLNSDTKVYQQWDRAMIAFIEANPEYAQVGYMGSLFNANLEGRDIAYGEQIDFIPGWCMCFKRNLYEKYGLFDSINLKFAYAEDADFSLRLKEAGYKIYALHLDLVEHYGNKTIKAVHEEKSHKLEETFALNHTYLRQRWGKSLKHLENQQLLS